MAASPASLRLGLGRRTLWRFERLLVRRRLTLEDGLCGRVLALPPLPEGASGYQLTAVPRSAVPAIKAAVPDLRLFVRQHYRRSYAALDRDFEAYLGALAAKSRSTLRRKVRKLEPLDIRTFRTPDEMADFHREARAVSARSYQERQLDAGLPDSEAALSEMRSLAARGAARGWILNIEGRAAAYLYAPAEGETLIYAYLGYDPDFAHRSPGTVLQFEVMRQLMTERCFRWFDFTEGDGRHKRLWAPGSLECVDLLLLKPTLSNLVLGHVLNGFDGAVALARRAASLTGLERVVRARLG